jgi:mannose-6-phosphate isomerase-like protein (cupin superfamily)
MRNRSNVSSYRTKDGSRVWELFHPGSSPVVGFSVAEALLGPGQGTRAHRHRMSQEVYYILEGGGVMRLGEDTFNVAPGDAILIPPGRTHSVNNNCAGVLRILCVCCPPYSHDDTALE